ncbi:MAG: antibiotic biosynthesis monooxygenase [Thermodesulfobacteriota bacterium]
MELRISKASAVVVQRIPAGLADWFMEWQNGVSGAAEGFAGYRGTDLYPPSDKAGEWVVVIHFEDEESLRGWLSSTVRAAWVEKLRAQVGDFELQAMPGGFGAWFAGLAHGPEGAAPSSWKMAISVLFGLYPTVMVLAIFPGPYLQPLGLAVAMLISNVLSVAILQWAVMPALNRLLASWLKAGARRQTALSVGGLLLILVLLAGLTLVFRQVTG